MSSDEDPKRSLITRNLKLAYGDVAAETVPERFQELLRRMDESKRGDDDLDSDSGIAAEPPKRPKGGPKSDAAAVTPQRSE